MDTEPKTVYQPFDSDFKRQPRVKVLVGALITTCVILLVMIIALVVYVVDNENGDYTPAGDEVGYCETVACLNLAASLASSINTSVDPCHDFYHYVCDGFVADNSWINIDEPTYNNFVYMQSEEKQTFLDALFYNTKPKLVNYSSVQKATTYMQTCYDSTVDREDEDTMNFLNKLLGNIYFAEDEDTTWDDDQTIEDFQAAITYLSQISFFTLFQLSSLGPKFPFFMQFTDLWGDSYDAINQTELFKTTYVPLYMELFNLTQSQANMAANRTMNFASSVQNITTINANYYDSTVFYTMLRVKNFTDLAKTFNDGKVMNYTKMIYDVYGATSDDLTYFVYVTDGVPFFTNLTVLIEDTPPFTVQLYLITSILSYYLNFESFTEQTRYISRTDFCWERTVSSFPFVYGYILFNEMYDNETYEAAKYLAKTILDDGTGVLIDNATWLDTSSTKNAMLKVNNMGLWIGFPDRIQYGKSINKYYQTVTQSMNNSWIKNVEILTTFSSQLDYGTFWNTTYPITAGWPTTFASDALYGSWLTGINAFYMPTGNWFTIPVSISQVPFIHADYPSSINFGGLGSVCGHEMSHGFDPSGSQYDYKGDYVGSIFSTSSQEKYDEKVQCFIEQYNNITVDKTKNGEKIYDNGTRTITENVADNAGVMSSWTAWKKHIEQHGDDDLLFGLLETQEQLFFLGYARLWCEASRPGAYANWTDVHSPNYARVIVPLQNNRHFADAYSCESGSFMNPKQKCKLW